MFQLPAPRAYALVVTSRNIFLHSHCYRSTMPYNITIVTLWLLLTDKINIATPSIIPRPTLEHRLIAFISDACTTYSSFTQIVHCRPDKVTNDIRIFFHEVPIL